ncbi:hypothetical protein KTK71_004601 [Salmonella enterica]|nr:hypothetical protein [Salmonella enterica]EHQ9355144.1 hypothetical protein [Salmonella enterica]EHR1671077.1 hypothetical protein [Salmonella enterica]EHR8097298.1 hypothetical protein [Salmonella enterica]EIE9498750.1 hypothetical protein [Salmonella enterica]
MSSLTDAGHVKVYLIIITGILAVTLLLTLIDRKMDDTFPESWFAGLAENFYHVMSIVTTGKTTHKLLFGSAGKIIAAIWMVCGVTIIACITSSITSTMTTHRFALNLQSPHTHELSTWLTGLHEKGELNRMKKYYFSN